MVLRFTEVSAPLETRVETRARAGLARAAEVLSHVGNATTSENTRERVQRVLRHDSPSTLLLVIALLVFVARRLLVHWTTRRILETHGHFASDANCKKR